MRRPQLDLIIAERLEARIIGSRQRPKLKGKAQMIIRKLKGNPRQALSRTELTTLIGFGVCSHMFDEIDIAPNSPETREWEQRALGHCSRLQHLEILMSVSSRWD